MNLSPENWLAYALLKGAAEFGGALEGNSRFGPSLVSGLLVELSNRIKIRLEEERYQYFGAHLASNYHYSKASSQLSWLVKKNLELRIADEFYFTQDREYLEMKLAFGLYF